MRSNKIVKVYGLYSNKSVVTLLITPIYMFILFYACLQEVDLEEGKSCPKPRFRNLEIYFTYALIPLLSRIFALAHKYSAFCILS